MRSLLKEMTTAGVPGTQLSNGTAANRHRAHKFPKNDFLSNPEQAVRRQILAQQDVMDAQNASPITRANQKRIHRGAPFNPYHSTFSAKERDTGPTGCKKSGAKHFQRRFLRPCDRNAPLVNENPNDLMNPRARVQPAGREVLITFGLSSRPSRRRQRESVPRGASAPSVEDLGRREICRERRRSGRMKRQTASDRQC